MKLKIENGILLKPFVLPWRPGGYVKPPGWTPDPDLPGLHDRALELDALMKEAGNAPPIPNLALRQAEVEYERKMAAAKKPYPGWMPISPQTDPDISRAYRRLFVQMNPDRDAPAMLTKLPGGREKVEWPPDGEYVYEKDRMEPVTNL